MKKLIKNNIKTVIAFLLGVIISAGSVYAASIYYNGVNVSYDNTTSGLKDSNDNDVEDVQTAIDVLYTTAQTELFMPKYKNLSGTPTNRAFGTPTTSDPETAPTGKNVYVGLYSNDGQYGICIQKNESGVTKEYCFRYNNWLAESDHMLEVFSNDSCSSTSTVVTCLSSDFYCGVRSNGYVFCTNRKPGDDDHCNISYVNSSPVIECIVDTQN